MNYAEYYYARTFGCIPYVLGEQPEQTEKTIKYLADNGLSTAEICEVLDEIGDRTCPPSNITPADLPQSLWDGSLIERNEFYYHRLLQITTPSPIFDPANCTIKSEPYYLEMRIRFTYKHLLEYFIRRSRIDVALVDEMRDVGSLKYLINKYSKIAAVRPLDFVLMLIDKATEDGFPLNCIFDIQRNEAEVLEGAKRMTAEASIHGGGRIIWR